MKNNLMTKTTYLKASFLFLLLTLTACSSSAVSGSQATCSQQGFPEFLHEFSSDVRVQQQAIAYPLVKMRIVDAEPEPGPEFTLLEKGSVNLPVVPDKNERETQGLLLEPTNVDKHHAKATLYKPDTDYQVIYLFENEGCWQLLEIQDWSL